MVFGKLLGRRKREDKGSDQRSLTPQENTGLVNTTPNSRPLAQQAVLSPSDSPASTSLPGRPPISTGENLGLKVLHEPKEQCPVSDIVFVHGLTGNAYTTWAHGNGTHWPSTLMAKTFPDARLIAFGYDADITKLWGPASSNRVANHAENMLGYLSRLRNLTNSEDRPIIFVAHSLGGLVTQRALNLSNSSSESDIRLLVKYTEGIVFLGTPHHGSDYAKWVTFASQLTRLLKRSNRDIVSVLKPDSETLAAIQKDFLGILSLRKDAASEIKITCFYEELSVPVVGEIVPKHSAIINPYRAYGIHADHMGMTKFPNAEDPGYGAVSGEIGRWVKVLRTKANQKSKNDSQAESNSYEELLRSLMFEDINERQYGVEYPHNNTFDWIWSRSRPSVGFADWLRSGEGLFWISGKPGSGKSTMIRYLCGHSNTQKEAEARINLEGGSVRLVRVSYFFDYKGSALTKSIEGMLRSLIRQILSVLKGQPWLIKLVFSIHQEMKNSPTGVIWRLRNLKNFLDQLLRKGFQLRFLIFIDALDEYQGEDDQIAKYFTVLARECKHNLMLCVSSRPHVDFRDQFGGYLQLRMELETGKDIIEYVSVVLRGLTQKGPRYQTILKEIVANAQGLFLWVKLASKELLRAARRGEDNSALLQRLRSMPQELDEIYMRILDQLEKNDQKEARTMLSIVMSTKEALTPLELRHAVHYSMDIYDDLDDPTLAELRIDVTCGGLLEFGNTLLLENALPEGQDAKVRFAHRTVHQFLNKNLTIVRQSDELGNILTGEVLLLKACLKAVIVLVTEREITRVIHAERKGGFFYYAMKWWATFAQLAEPEAPQILHLFSEKYYAPWRRERLPFRHNGPLLGLERDFVRHTRLRDLYNLPILPENRSSIDRYTTTAETRYDEELPAEFLELAISLGLNNFAREEIDSMMASNSDQSLRSHFDVNRNGGSLLFAVARGGSLEIAKVLFDRGAKISPDMPLAYGALCRALYFQHDNLLPLLIEKGGDMYHEAMYLTGKRAFPIWVALRGSSQEERIKSLIRNGFDINVRSSYWGNTLQYACRLQSLELVQLLLNNNSSVNISVARSIFGSALEATIYFPHDMRIKVLRPDIGRILLRHGADPNVKRPVNHEPVLWDIWGKIRNILDFGVYNHLLQSPKAVKHSHQYFYFFELLLGYGADANLTNGEGQTLLFEISRHLLSKQVLGIFTTKTAALLAEHGARLKDDELADFGKTRQEEAEFIAHIVSKAEARERAETRGRMRAWDRFEKKWQEHQRTEVRRELEKEQES